MAAASLSGERLGLLVWAGLYGHGVHPDAGLWVEDRGNGFFYAHCDVCNYLSARRSSAEMAADALRHHVLVFERSARANGVPMGQRRRLTVELRRTYEPDSTDTPGDTPDA